MKTCFNTITAGPDAPLEVVVRACATAGFDGVEIDLNHLDRYLEHHSLAEARRMLDDGGIALASLMAFPLEVYGDPTDHLRTLARGAELAGELGGDVLLVFCGAGVPGGMTHQDALELAAERAAMYADAAGAARIALEPIGRTQLMPGPDEALAVAAGSGRPNVGIMMDSFHYHLSGISLDRVRQLPAEQLLIVHVDDCEDLPVDQLSDSHRLMPGRGILPLVETFRILDEIGYTGYLSLELFRPEYWGWPVEQTVSTAATELRQVLSEAGLNS